MSEKKLFNLNIAVKMVQNRCKSAQMNTKCWSEARVLETGDCKTKEILHFPTFRLRSLTEETGYKCPELDLLTGLVF